MQFKKSLMTATLVTLGGFAAMSANAASPTTDTFDVSMKVDSICTIDTSSMDVTLAATEAGQATTEATTATTNLILNCSKGATATISLTPGNSATDGTGVLTGGVSAETVAYKLTSDLAGDTPWGTDTTVATAVFADYATAIETPIYLTVTDKADVAPDTYTDTITVSVAY